MDLAWPEHIPVEEAGGMGMPNTFLASWQGQKCLDLMVLRSESQSRSSYRTREYPDLEGTHKDH